MVDAMEKGPSKRVWGEMETRGGRGVFRQRLLLEAFAKRVPRGRVLDAGCGDGSLTMALLEHGYHVVAVDASELAVARLEDKVRDIGKWMKLETRVAGLERIDQPDESIEGIVCGEVLEHLEDDIVAVQEFFRILKPGGFCVVTAPADPRKWSFVDDWSGHFRRYTKDSLTELFTQAGFHVEIIHYWGWPVLTVYDRFFFRAWARRHREETSEECAGQKSTRFFQSSPVARVMAFAFSLDRLFLRLPFGIGILGCFQKPETRKP
jgi:ubiquinone/menaquinone biosynthesis C-methylase UbiE